jgi:hypothetical protein
METTLRLPMHCNEVMKWLHKMNTDGILILVFVRESFLGIHVLRNYIWQKEKSEMLSLKIFINSVLAHIYEVNGTRIMSNLRNIYFLWCTYA